MRFASVFVIGKPSDLSKIDFSIVNFSDQIKKSENEIRNFLRFKMYNNKNVLKKIIKVN